MRLSYIMAYTASTVGALFVDDDFWFSDTVLQARQLDDHLHLSRSIPLQHQGYNDLLPRSYTLLRRADRPQASQPSRRQGSQGSPGSLRRQDSGSSSSSIPDEFADAVPARSGSPTIRASTMAQGKAALTVGPLEAPRGRLDVPQGGVGGIHDHHPLYTSARAVSQQSPPREGQRPRKQVLQASAKGQMVIGTVEPGQGGRGHIRTETSEGVKEHPVTDPRGDYKAEASGIPGGAKVTATSFRGGKVNAIAVDRGNAPPSRGA